ncbi:transporter substrate-binding domain-containing protein [Duganella sp. FT3S]|uniref:Transporter substrate-binding domain-containing protein n=1 Tax=Rugamonas fusca TaxID=2758568 RepID=A0A7W2I9K3_9BURK|nr:transporter substrate-binding domain-containing protein [Rugamonas fusca]MBA5608792.1 transporter substrate-binding domain-containing protein [Rugamonas fusca]
MRFIFALIWILAWSSVRAEDLYVPKFNEREPWTPYIVELLTGALARTPGATPDRWHWVETRMTQDRALALLRSGKELDLYWSMTSAPREQGVLTVRIPLMKGLLGSRLMIIRKDSVDKFSRINSLDDLKRNIAIGQGLDWPDTAIEQAAGLRVVTSSSYETLFQMLKAKRFDGIALGVNEIDDELAKQHDAELVIEQHLALSYPAPVFFFVSPRNPALAERIEKGLLLMIKDGTFNALFDKRWRKAQLINHMKGRLVLPLSNPLLSPETADMIRQHPEYFLFAPARQGH